METVKEQAMDQAQKDLMEKREKIQQQRESTMASVKSCLSDGNIDKARSEALLLDGTKYWDSIIELFKQSVKRDICPVCKTQELHFYLNPNTLHVRHQEICEDCHTAQANESRQKILIRQRDEFIERIDVHLGTHGVPKRFLSASLADFPEQYGVLYQGDRGAFLTGPRGTGKTHLAVAIMRQLCMVAATGSVVTGRPIGSMPIFTSVPDLLLEIRDSYRDDSQVTERQLIERYALIPILVLDDLGAEKTTEWALQTLFVIIDRRYRNMLRTIITSNLSLKEISEKVGDRIASRIAEMCDVKIIKGDDRRLRR